MGRFKSNERQKYSNSKSRFRGKLWKYGISRRKVIEGSLRCNGGIRKTVALNSIESLKWKKYNKVMQICQKYRKVPHSVIHNEKKLSLGSRSVAKNSTLQTETKLMFEADTLREELEMKA